MVRDIIETPTRFWNKVDIQGLNDCWDWIAGCSKDGYGHFHLDYVDWRAHRLAWTLVNGPIPKGMHICHHCDNPKCINPRHLFLCTNEMNSADMIAKGRGIRGSANPNVKLTEDEVCKIRILYTTGRFTQVELATVFGVTNMTISHIVRGKTWKHLL